jgi:cytochrome c biogenesis protein CcmG/thiol:disulfide interchange protein DsbE
MGKTGRYLLFALPLLVFMALALLFWSRIGQDPTELPSARIDKPLPDFRLTALNDPLRNYTQNDVKGDIVLLNVWATWCVSCQVEHPVLKQLAASGIPIVGVNYKDDRAAALQYLQNHGDPYRFTVFDDAGSFGLDLGVYGAPETYLIDKQGRVRYRFVGVLDPEHWDRELKPRYEALLQGKALPETSPVVPETSSVGPETSPAANGG